MVKIAHLSDLHLGYKSGRIKNKQDLNLREADGYVAFSNLVTDVINEKPDFAILAGDTFHNPTPDMRTVLFAQNQFRRFWEAGIPVYIIAGNHDTSDIKSEIAASRILHDPWRKIYSHIEPYIKYEAYPGIFIHLVSHHMYSEQDETMRNIKTVDGTINIFSTHGSIIDPILKEKLHTDQSPREIVIPDFLIEDNDWDYIMLGHIHERGWVGSKDKKSDTSNTKLFYNGSLIRRGFSDKAVPLGRGWTLWTMGTDGKFTPEIKTVQQRPQYDFPVINAESFTSQEITDAIIKNLVTTQVESNVFEPITAPILRQTLLNVSPAKYAALDWKSISNNSKHSMAWNIKTSTDKELKTDSKEQFLGDNISETGDVVKLYDNWVDNSNILDETDDKLKDLVKEQARKFVESGQEAALGTE